MTTSATPVAPSSLGARLRTLYYIRAVFAVLWGVTLIVAMPAGALLTVLLVIYPLVDAVSVFWQLRSEGSAQASRVPEWINVVLSVETDRKSVV